MMLSYNFHRHIRYLWNYKVHRSSTLQKFSNTVLIRNMVIRDCYMYQELMSTAKLLHRGILACTEVSVEMLNKHPIKWRICCLWKFSIHDK